jgi:uncharacterized protein (TIGR02996 family)
MPRYEMVEGKSSKFWEIEKAKGGYAIRWGRIGAEGQTQLKKLTPEQHAKLVDEKLRKGYRPAGVKLAKSTKPTASNSKLEETLYEAIEDRERWLVYADWLQQQGDPRGEIIALSLAGKKAAAKKRAAAHVDALWGEAAPLREDDYFSKLYWTPNYKGAKPTPVDVAFSYELGAEGMIEAIKVEGLDEDGHVAGALQALLTAPIGRFVRSIALESVHVERYSGASGMPNFDHVAAAIARAKPTALRSLSLGSSGYQISWTHTGRLGPLLKATPYLERLSIELGNIDLGKDLALPRLRSLHVETGGLGRKNVVAIANAKWPVLEELVLFLGCKDYGGSVKRADVEALLATAFPKLTKLGLCNAEIQADVVQLLVRWPLLKQLRSLDLSKGTLTDAEVAPVVDNLAAFSKLQAIDLSESYLTDDFERRLKKSFGKAFVGGGSRYDEMVEEQEETAGEDWAKNETFRYTVVAE